MSRTSDFVVESRQRPLGITNRDEIEANLQHWHPPTGWVTLEEVLRFCIVDLGVIPLSDRWSQILRESDERFKADFVGPGEA